MKSQLSAAAAKVPSGRNVLPLVIFEILGMGPSRVSRDLCKKALPVDPIQKNKARLCEPKIEGFLWRVGLAGFVSVLDFEYTFRKNYRSLTSKVIFSIIV